jgi:hypothetical protein
MKSSLLSLAWFLKPSSSKSNDVDTIVHNTSVNIYDDVEIVTAGQTLHRETRRISQVEQQEYPSSKKSVDGKTLYQKSLSRQPKPSGAQTIVDLTDEDLEPSRAVTPDPDVTLTHAFQQLSSPSAQRSYDISPQLDQHAAEDRSSSPTQSRMSLDSFFNEKKKSESMLVRDSIEMEEDEVQFIAEKKLKFEKEVIPLAGSSKGILPSIVADISVVSSKIALPALSEVVTKKNFNKMVLESNILDGKWNLSYAAIVAIIKRDIRFTLVAEEKLAGYKSKPKDSLVIGLNKYRARNEDEFTNEQMRREGNWKPDSNNLKYSKETYQLQPLLDCGIIDGYSIESVQSGGTADIVLTAASTRENPLSWSDKLLLPVFLPIEAKCSFLSNRNSNQLQHNINGLSGHPNCTAFISLYQYDIQSQPRLFAVILAKKIEVILRYISVSKAGLAMVSYTSNISKVTGMLTEIKWNASMEQVVKDKDAVVRTINDFTAEQLGNPDWVIRQFIAWSDPESSLMIADFQSESLSVEKGNLCEELTSIAFRSVAGAVSRQGESITGDHVDLWMVKGDDEVSISCKTIHKNHGNLKWWMFPLRERFEGQKVVPVTYERSCDIWSAAAHSDLIDPNFIALKAPKGTNWIVFVFTKSQLKNRLGLKHFMYLKAGEHLDKAIYFNSEKKILNPEIIDRLVPLFQK